MHLVVYAAVHVMFLLLYGVTDVLSEGPFRDETANQVTRVWTMVLAVDTVISWSYTIFPKKQSPRKNQRF
ncbi:hypothetical protein EV586_106137 [Tumebacillus sp. BK434]|uniref:hypothetical protein n=1 Tax=Tumebacillus sp. BK434 TaxID=2512169 RepID=UPI001053366D|nr:hypothetical protein [Tumebacillus sp. BK434]TCP53389.1 hypothetical protein EV586_106137 [Tumebacillus sp. BK434]